MGKNKKDLIKIEKKARLALSKKKREKDRKKLVYEYTICGIALLGTVLAVVDIFRGLNPWMLWIDRAVLIILAADYFVRLYQAEDKKEFFRENIFHLIAILPFHSTLRIFGLSRLTKFAKLIIIGAFPKKVFRKFRIFLNTNGLKNVLLLTIMAVFLGAVGIMFTEGMNFGDAIWWAFVTATTVGYGDLSPSTSLGRLIAAVLMIFGIGLIGSITSTITSYFLNPGRSDYKEETLELIKKKIDDVSNLTDDEIDAICKVLKTLNK